ncbi:MAG: hypothetical protein RMJ59_01970 [Candidatus Nitrosocaldus sp.]|nr:hypothetical protein [Candidatus Nitrosocaldus sp.]MCS7140641.1 hypothetical protein [Candidatus Nitrosocaldus sp.]MDW7999544.1 hypothetical protein [Candidatus Nitrosocaldus sp.]MDW8275133.1 hypothetical protein [Candidatus Nitrosocaldus sp.]
MEIEIEFVAKGSDKVEILSKIAQLARTANELGLSIKEIEFEEEEEEEEEE